MSHTSRGRPKGTSPKKAKPKKPAPDWMRKKFHMGSQQAQTDAMNEGMRRAAERD